nr:hypothetical protein [uncultured Merdimonas sp.]
MDDNDTPLIHQATDRPTFSCNQLRLLEDLCRYLCRIPAVMFPMISGV